MAKHTMKIYNTTSKAKIRRKTKKNKQINTQKQNKEEKKSSKYNFIKTPPKFV